MRTISMDLINQVREIREKAGISTKAALEIMADTGVCCASQLPDPAIMDAILRGLNKKHSKEKTRV